MGRRRPSAAREDALPASPRSCGRRGDVRGRIWTPSTLRSAPAPSPDAENMLRVSSSTSLKGSEDIRMSRGSRVPHSRWLPPPTGSPQARARTRRRSAATPRDNSRRSQVRVYTIRHRGRPTAIRHRQFATSRTGFIRSRRGGGESLRLLGARCAAAARNPRSNMSRVKVLDFTLWQEQWSLKWSRAAAPCAATTSHARRSIVNKSSRVLCVSCLFPLARVALGNVSRLASVV